MPNDTPRHLSPRKRPVQARATVTLDAIFEATVQVLVAEGPDRLTTTRVAKRAGVSVGTMYQYFPHKQALFYALNERYLTALADRLDEAAQAQRGAPIADMVGAIITTYWEVKMDRPEVTRALYRSVVELDNEQLIETFARRADATTAAMLETASDASFVDLRTVTLTLLTTIFGAVRNVFERDLSADEAQAVRHELNLMCIAYLTAVRRES